MYAAHRFEGTYTRPFIEPPAPWPRQNFAEPDVLEIEPGDLKTGSYPAGSLTETHLGQIKAASAQAEKATRQPTPYIHDDRDRVKARFRLLRRLPADHDNEGAAAAQPESVDAAIAFIDWVRAYPARFYATLDDDGSAVIEFEDRGTGFFADVTFRGKDEVVCYVRQPNSQSQLIEGQLSSRPIRHFLLSKMQVIL
jgi:hypothetical protein